MIHLHNFKDFYKNIQKGDIVVRLNGNDKLLWKGLILSVNPEIRAWVLFQNFYFTTFLFKENDIIEIEKGYEGYFWGSILNRSE